MKEKLILDSHENETEPEKIANWFIFENQTALKVLLNLVLSADLPKNNFLTFGSTSC